MENFSPYEKWLESKVDSRGDFTQIESYTRDKLSELDFALVNNRVNPGPYEETRRQIATNMQQSPHYFGNTDRYGWADWVRNRASQPSNLAPQLKEAGDTIVPGSEYSSTYFRRPLTNSPCGRCRRNR